MKWFFFREQLKVIARYYSRGRFALLDLAYGLVALVWNPYRVCRKFLQRRGSPEPFAYGETPLTEFQRLMEAVGLTAADRYVELGSGRGKTCLWAALFVGCGVRGVEWVPQFVRLARSLSQMLRIPAVFEERSMLETTLSDATVVYFYGIDREIEPLLPLFEQMPRTARLITISEPLASSSWELVRSLAVSFPWGKTEAFLHVKVN